MDDLLSSVDGGKHDYDWLLTPTGSPQPTGVSSRRGPLSGSVSTTKSSRLSVTQSENKFSSRPTRSSSATPSSKSAVNYDNYSSNNRSSILNTSTSSVTSISRSSTSSSRSTLSSTTRHSTPTRQSTSIRSRPSPTSSSNERNRSSQNSRPSTTSSQPQITAFSVRSNSRPLTSTRSPTPARRISKLTPPHRISTPTPATITGHAVYTRRTISSDRNVKPISRGSSPVSGPRVPIVPLDFSLDITRRSTMPNRPISATRSRPGASVSERGNSETTDPVNHLRRQSSPVVTKGRLPETLGRNRLFANGNDIGGPPENKKTSAVSELAMRNNTKPVISTENNGGYGRTISKKSLDMALRHMDIRSGAGNIRSLSGTVFPQSLHSGKPKSQASFCNNIEQSPISNNYFGISKNINNNGRSLEGEYEKYDGFSAKLIGKPDIYESSRYNAILFTEDLKNTNWLHSIDATSDQGLIFDHRFESLPEPFDPL